MLTKRSPWDIIDWKPQLIQEAKLENMTGAVGNIQTSAFLLEWRKKIHTLEFFRATYMDAYFQNVNCYCFLSAF